jgi:hypothetical protein
MLHSWHFDMPVLMNIFGDNAGAGGFVLFDDVCCECSGSVGDI